MTPLSSTKKPSDSTELMEVSWQQASSSLDTNTLKDATTTGSSLLGDNGKENPLGSLVLKVLQDHKELKVLKVSLVTMVFQGLLVLKETLVTLARKEIKDSKV
jgi:hypothetical protein